MSDRLGKARARFECRLDTAQDFVARTVSARHARHQRPCFPVTQRHWAYEVALLKSVAAAEGFFEDSMALYIIGERSPSGFRPRRRTSVEASHPQALDMLKGDQMFVGWNSPDVIIQRAHRWFVDGKPFESALSGGAQVLSYVRALRNVIAHDSRSARVKLVRETRRLYGAVPGKVIPGNQLSCAPPPGISYLRGSSLFEAIVRTYRAVASQIVP